jgi:hypothetical protein
MSEETIRDESGRVIGTVTRYPDSPAQRAARIVQAGQQAASALRLTPGQRRTLTRVRRRAASA